MARQTALLWLRQDLRLADNPALLHAVQGGYGIIPVFILDDDNAGTRRCAGGCTGVWRG